ncbi:hypothetical protein BJ969_003979 [Saccharopolyspora gloriosae]|uniref:Uncharacterized protein n=1 Tax=Saccharopolyspora gloriosae TaxID=455344 RepID=A0A840NIL1_9PSEU|nr:hypothetical protein [Saccharopolyspora gloriosae]
MTHRPESPSSAVPGHLTQERLEIRLRIISDELPGKTS